LSPSALVEWPHGPATNPCVPEAELILGLGRAMLWQSRQYINYTSRCKNSQVCICAGITCIANIFCQTGVDLSWLQESGRPAERLHDRENHGKQMSQG
jgi:hypothetical protein